MSAVEIIDQLRALSPAERREAVGKIWEEFADQDLELTAAQGAELDRRLAEHQANPDDVVPWNSIKAETEAKFGRKP